MCKKISIFLVAIILVVFVGCANFGIAFAEEATTYSGVLDDLQKDENFKVEDYPKDSNDNSLKVIQIAESENDELFLYVYQPAGNIEATSINISQEETPDVSDTHNRKLTLIDKHETLFKYKVEDVVVKANLERYYEIASIFRAWNKRLDEENEHEDNTTEEVSYEVGQMWKATDVGDSVVYSMTTIETIKILNPYVNYVSYDQGFYWWSSSTDSVYSHYVAFTTDKKMDDLLKASVYFESRGVRMSYGVYTYSEPVSHELVIAKEQNVSSTNSAKLYSEDYNYSRIVKTADFVSNEDKKLDTKAKTALSDTTWVLRFWETVLTMSGKVDHIVIDSTQVTNVTILRLEFETDGVVYSLGTVMNKVTSDNQPLNPPDVSADDPWQSFLDKLYAMLDDVAKFFQNIGDWFTLVFAFIKEYWWILAVVVGLIVVGILCSVAKPVWIAVKYLFIALWYVITAPLQLIVFVIRKISEKKKQ